MLLWLAQHGGSGRIGRRAKSAYSTSILYTRIDSPVAPQEFDLRRSIGGEKAPSWWP